MTDTAQEGGSTPKKDQGKEPFTLDSGGGPKEGLFAGQGPLKEDNIVATVEKIKK
jgi:hypothetical protein